jgi:sporulation protein YlmC with PRC-barrel domain
VDDIDLIRDVLDNQLVDRNQRRIGKVDGIVIELVSGRPPVLKAIEAGWVTKARRLHPRIAGWIGRWSKPYRIPWKSIRDIGVDVEVDIDADKTPLLRFEKRLRKVLMRIPGA